MVNRISKALGRFDNLSFEHLLPIKIGGKKILVLWDGQMKEHEVYGILFTRYDEWVERNGAESTESIECKNWMFARLDETGLQYIKLYIG